MTDLALSNILHHSLPPTEMTQAKAETTGGGGSGAAVGAMDTRRALLCLVAIFLVSLSALTFVYKNFPHLEE